jgi:hypothetical protein
VQCDGVNEWLVEALSELHIHSNVQGLFDRSHGGGHKPASWPVRTFFAAGYAGGLGPEDLDTDLPAIFAAANHGSHQTPFWIDMETRLFSHRGPRTTFDLEKCQRVLTIAQPYMRSCV